MHREKGRSSQDHTPYTRSLWGTKSHTPNALLGLVFKKLEKLLVLFCCAGKRALSLGRGVSWHDAMTPL